MHLSPPDGARRPYCDDADIEEGEDDDRIRYRDQLQILGQIARSVPDHSLTVICKLVQSATVFITMYKSLISLLQTTTNKLVNHVQAMQSRPMTIAEATALNNLFEDLHWALLVAGHTLCVDTQGEYPQMPSEIVAHSAHEYQIGKTTKEATFHTLAAIEAKSGTAPDDFDKCDSVFRYL